MVQATIVTCHRRSVDYLSRTRESVERAGFSACVFDDSFPSTGIIPAFRRAAYSMRLSMGVDNTVALFQDDVEVAIGLSDWLEEKGPLDGVISLYSSSVHDGLGDGLVKMDFTPTEENPHPTMNSIGACAFAFRKSHLWQIVKLDPPIRTDRLGQWIADSCHLLGIPFYIHNPSLVQHVGEVSVRRSVPFTKERQAARFCRDVKELK